MAASSVTPTISALADDATGTSLTATLVADNPADEIWLMYRKTSDADWSTFGSTRSGSGDLQLTGLGLFRYEVIAIASQNGGIGEDPSPPSGPKFQTVTAGSSGETASGAISLPGEHLRTLLADGATFQAMVGAGNAGEAKASIYYPAIDDSVYARPCALIYQNDDWRHPSVSRGAAEHFGEQGTLYLALERDIASAYQDDGQEENAYLEFANPLGEIILEMEALAGTASYLNVRGIRPVAGPERLSRSRETQTERYYRVVLEVEWGIR